MKYLLFILSLLSLTSCSKFKDGTSVWADWVWTIPVGMFIAAGILFAVSYSSSKSGSTTQSNPGVDTGNVPMTSQAKFWGGVILVAIAIGVIIYQNSQK